MLIKIFKRFTYSHLLIALAAAFQLCLSYLLFGYEVSCHVVIVQGACTLLFYNLSFWASKPKCPEKSIYERTRWFWRNWPWMLFNSLIALIALLLVINGLRIELYVYIFILGMISLGYMVPFIAWRGKKLSLRDVPGLKLFVICGIWTMSVVGLPYLDLTLAGHPVGVGQILYIGLGNFLFLLICTLPFDIRDAKQDKLYELKTIPIIIGDKRARIICFAMLALHFFMVFVGDLPIAIQIGMLITNTLVLTVYCYLFSYKSKCIHTYMLDAILVIQSILVWSFSVFGREWLE